MVTDTGFGKFSLAHFLKKVACQPLSKFAMFTFVASNTMPFNIVFFFIKCRRKQDFWIFGGGT